MHSPEKPSIYLPVNGSTAWMVLIGLTILFLAVGMAVFTRSEYHDMS